MVLGTGLALALGALVFDGGHEHDAPFKLYGFYGWKYEEGRPTVNDRSRCRRWRPRLTSAKESRYIHDSAFGEEVKSHLRSHYLDAHYPHCQSLAFIPHQDRPGASGGRSGSHRRLVSVSHRRWPRLADFVRRALDHDRVLPWKYLHYLRTHRSHGYDLHLSKSFLDEHNRLLWDARLSRGRAHHRARLPARGGILQGLRARALPSEPLAGRPDGALAALLREANQQEKAKSERVELWEQIYKTSLAAPQQVQRKMLASFGEKVFGDLLPRLRQQLEQALKGASPTYREI